MLTRVKIYLHPLMVMLLASLLIVNLFFYVVLPGMMFFPLSHIDATPKEWGLDYQDITLNLSEKEKLTAWYIPHPDANKTVLFFHGNGGNISHRAQSVLLFHQLKLNVFIIDYPGYGKSTGNASEHGLYNSANLAWDYLLTEKQLQEKNIIIFGRSLGGAVAIDLASRVNSGALIIESTFTSVRDMAGTLMPLLSKFIYLRYSFASIDKINNITSPLLVIHSKEDEMIPYEFGNKLFQQAITAKEFLEIQGSHNDGFIKSMPSYKNSLMQFLEKYQLL